MAFARFVTGLMMHICMNTELKMGMQKMKFVINHKWKFKEWRKAYLCGLAQVSITIMVTVINYFVIIFSPSIIDIVKDFLAIKVISELDDYFFSEHTGKDEVA